MICPVSIASDMSALQAARVGDHGRHGVLHAGRSGAGNEGTGSNFAGDGKEDNVPAKPKFFITFPPAPHLPIADPDDLGRLLKCDRDFSPTYIADFPESERVAARATLFLRHGTFVE
jgi:hypothetical protein